MVARFVRWAAVLIAVCLPAAAAAQAYPSKPVRFVVGFAPGGSVDILGRIFAQRMTQSLGHQVIVDNRPGAGSNIAGTVVAKAPADGYTLLVGSAGGLAGNLAIYRNMPYDPFKDFAPISLLVFQGNVLIVNPSVPSKTVKELVALARSRPGVFNGGSGGNGSSQHLSLEFFMQKAGVKMLHVPYKGGAPAMADLLGGQIDLMFQTIPEALPHLPSGRVRALGVTAAKRSAALPNVPTIAEAGLTGFEFDGFMALVGPAGMPAELVSRLNTEVNAALADNAVRTRLLESGLELAGGTPAQLTAKMREQADNMIRLAKEAGIKPVD